MSSYNGKTYRKKTYQPRFIGNQQVDKVTDEIYRILNKLDSDNEQFVSVAKEELKKLLTLVSLHTHGGGPSALWGIPVLAAAPTPVAGMAIPYINSAEPYVVRILFPTGVDEIFFEWVV